MLHDPSDAMSDLIVKHHSLPVHRDFAPSRRGSEPSGGRWAVIGVNTYDRKVNQLAGELHSILGRP